MRFVWRLLVLSILLAAVQAAHADWFVSSEAKEWMAKARAGDVEAQFRVGAAYDSGHGAPHDRAEALKWYTMAAEAGYAEAKNSLGSMMQAEKNYVQARTWYERAAAQGHAQATNSLGFLYDLGLGVPQDRHKGFELYTRAADLGWAEAMWNLANMYGAGQLGSKDMEMACVWTFRARRNASPQDERLLAVLRRAGTAVEQQLDTEQRNRCYQQATDWTPSGTLARSRQAASSMVAHPDPGASEPASPVEPTSVNR
jgi:TPR repeat protein